MALLRAMYGALPPRSREMLKLAFNAYGHHRSLLDRLNALEHAFGKKRLDRVAVSMVGLLERSGIASLKDASCLEFGAGYVPTEILVFHLLGAETVVATDYNAIADLRRIITAARAAAPGPVIAALSKFEDRGRIEARLERIVSGRTSDALAYLKGQVQYIAPHDLSVTGLGIPFDFIHSISVFEHIPEPDLEPIITNLFGALRKGGRMITEIDLRDHRDFKENPLGFLAQGTDYDPARDADRRGNRLRRRDWLDLFASRNDLTTTTLVEKHLDQSHLPAELHSYAKNKDPEDMLVGWIGLLSAR